MTSPYCKDCTLSGHCEIQTRLQRARDVTAIPATVDAGPGTCFAIDITRCEGRVTRGDGFHRFHQLISEGVSPFKAGVQTSLEKWKLIHTMVEDLSYLMGARCGLCFLHEDAHCRGCELEDSCLHKLSSPYRGAINAIDELETAVTAQIDELHSLQGGDQ